MRRNKLLLEHILHERLQRTLSQIQYYEDKEQRKLAHIASERVLKSKDSSLNTVLNGE